MVLVQEIELLFLHWRHPDICGISWVLVLLLFSLPFSSMANLVATLILLISIVSSISSKRIMFISSFIGFIIWFFLSSSSDCSSMVGFGFFFLLHHFLKSNFSSFPINLWAMFSEPRKPKNDHLFPYSGDIKSFFEIFWSNFEFQVHIGFDCSFLVYNSINVLSTSHCPTCFMQSPNRIFLAEFPAKFLVLVWA